MRESVEITMLGKFTIFGPGMAAPQSRQPDGKSRRLWILTAYLILNRERGVSARELIDLLWPDSESSDPMATLQNDVSRARNALEELGLRDGKKLICNRSGTYYWAPNTETVLDCEQFRTALRACLDEVGNIKDEALAARAIGMYSDRFSPGMCHRQLVRQYKCLLSRVLFAALPENDGPSAGSAGLCRGGADLSPGAGA